MVNDLFPLLRVLVVADHLLVRTGLAALLTAQAEVQIVGQVSASDTLTDDLDLYRPDVVVYDLGYDAAAALPYLEALVGVPLVALLPNTAAAASVAGALMPEDRQQGLGMTGYGLLLRDRPTDPLMAALTAVANGLVVIDPLLTPALIAPELPAAEALPDSLTPREAQVLQLLAEGLPNKVIAQRLAISPNTVKFHINAILTKLGVQSRTEAVIRATRLGLVIL